MTVVNRGLSRAWRVAKTNAALSIRGRRRILIFVLCGVLSSASLGYFLLRAISQSPVSHRAAQVPRSKPETIRLPQSDYFGVSVAELVPSGYLLDEYVLLPDVGKVTLHKPAVSVLAGWMSPVGLASPDGRFLAYNAWDQFVPVDHSKRNSEQGLREGMAIATPNIRLFDLAATSDRILVQGAYSIAWSDSGLAYVQGIERDYAIAKPYLGHVMVRPTVAAAASVWTESPGKYIVVGWAENRLLVYREHEEGVDLLVYDGPKAIRKVIKDSALVALSPSGKQALVTRFPGLTTIELWDLASVQPTPLHTLDLRRSDINSDEDGIGIISYGGSWVDDQIAARSNNSLVVFRIAESRITVDRVVVLDPELLPLGVHEPLLLPGSKISAWAPPRRPTSVYLFVECDLVGNRCLVTDTKGYGEIDNLNRLYNLSKPSGRTQ